MSFEGAVALCSDEDSGCSFPDPAGVIEFYDACIEAGVDIPDQVFRVDAKVTADNPGVWFTSGGVEVSEDVGGFAAADCVVGTGPGEASEVTCGVNLFLEQFTCLAPDEPKAAIIGGTPIPPPTAPPQASCPDDGRDWLYINHDLCIE